MPTIDIRRKHDRSPTEAKAAVQRVADHIAEKFDVDWRWEGHTLHFERSGVDGHIRLGKGSVHVTARLGFLLMAIQGSVEREIHRYLDQEFG